MRRRRENNKNEEEEEEEEEGNVVKTKDSLLSLTILIDFFQIADPTSTLHRPYQNNQNEEEKKIKLWRREIKIEEGYKIEKGEG